MVARSISLRLVSLQDQESTTLQMPSLKVAKEMRRSAPHRDLTCGTQIERLKKVLLDLLTSETTTHHSEVEKELIWVPNTRQSQVRRQDPANIKHKILAKVRAS